MIGKILSAPFKIINAPIRAAENLLEGDDVPEEERIFSKPLDAIADELEKIDE